MCICVWWSITQKLQYCQIDWVDFLHTEMLNHRIKQAYSRFDIYTQFQDCAPYRNDTTQFAERNYIFINP